MSYFSAAPLQEAVFAALNADAGLGALVAGRIYDTPPDGLDAAGAPYVIIGDERVRDWSSNSHSGARHDLAIAVHSDAAGFAVAKAVAGAVTQALDGADLALAAGHLVSIQFYAARAKRSLSPAARRIDLTFRALVQTS